MKNDTKEKFLDCIRKIEGTNIVLKYKLRSVYNGEIFFIQNKTYALDFCTICNSSIQFIYIFTN